MARLISVSPPTSFKTALILIGWINFLATTPAATTDTALTDPVYTDIVSVSYPESGKVTFNCLVDFTDANGVRVTEFGLLNANLELFSHKVRAVVDGETVTGVIDKDSDMKIVVTWTLRF